MPEPIALPHDVRSRLNLSDATTGDAELSDGGMSDDDISTYLNDAVFKIAQVNDFEAIEADVRKQLEWRLAAIDILSTRIGHRAYHQQSLGSMSRSYEVKMIDKLREDVSQICQSNDLENPIAKNTLGGVQRDTDRYVRATNPD